VSGVICARVPICARVCRTPHPRGPTHDRFPALAVAAGVPLALLALVLYPIVWLLLLPLRLVGITVSAVFAFLGALLMLPARVLRGHPV
jgi:hypothetical protein